MSNDIDWWNGNYYKLSSSQVMEVLDLADKHRYRTPKNANGSRAWCFFYSEQRRLKREKEAYVKGM